MDTLDLSLTEELTLNLAKISEKYNLILQKILDKSKVRSTSNSFLISELISDTLSNIYFNPERLLRYQLEYTSNYFELLNNSMSKFMGNSTEVLYSPTNRDFRFKDPVWNENLFFDFLKQSYLMTAKWLQKIVFDLEGIDDKTLQKIHFYTKQYIEAIAPTNFAFTNPEVLRETLLTNGQNLVRGLDKLLVDLERSKKFIDIETTDSKAFKVGENIGTSKGKVIYENELMQLLCYEPLVKKNYDTPLLIIPPWINKFYILDLREKNSFVKWLLEQGYQVFMISWVNPGKELKSKNFEDYMQEGPLAALNAIEKAFGKKNVNAIGYCLGGTLLAATLAYMSVKKDNRIKSATFLTTLLDFTEAGELGVFVDEQQIAQMEEQMEKDGFLDGSDMATTFNMLKPNEMIWSFYINNYLLGKELSAFDMLYWNADSTRLTSKSHSFYLRNMYQKNCFKDPGGITLCNVSIDLRKIKVPSYFLSTKEDHIALWRSTYRGTNILQGNVTFTLTASGHVAGVVNHPANNKYSYWVNNKIESSPEAWLEGSTEHKGSWWPHWHEWNKAHSGKLAPAKSATDSKIGVIEDAPGRYVLVK